MSEAGPAAELSGALHDIARVDRLLVALDFDGTLAPEVDDPGQARAIPEARAAVLRLLALPDTRVALISGRALASLELVSDLPDNALLVGSHGIEIRLDGGEHELILDESELRRREALSRVLEKVVESLDQVWIEPKPAGFAVHTRLATEADSRTAHRVALEAAHKEDAELNVREGKNVLEFSVRSTHKGEAIDHLRGYTEADAVFFAGDDVTDEDAFAALQPRDVGLKSGPGETVAAYRVPGPLQVAHALDLLAEHREGSRQGKRPAP